MLEALSRPGVWQEFLEYKLAGGHLSREDAAELTAFIEAKGYLTVVERIRNGQGFAPPKKMAISKMHTAKKRIVYTYAPEENWVLKLLTYLLHNKYDHLFADNLYSFRRQKGVRDAVKKLTGTPDIQHMWSYKVDISNYFNSVPVEKLLPRLQKVLEEERETYRFLAALLTDPLVEENGVLIPEDKGIMAGTPISTFLANLYLRHMDSYFAERGVLYARYSDDVILFASSREAVGEYAERIKAFLAEDGLMVNADKEAHTGPGEMWVFLGISYGNGVVDVAPASAEKLKAKMRRKTRALARWQAKKGPTGTQTAKAFIRVLNRKLFENTAEHELTWGRWYFPLINTTRTLEEIDAYAQSCIRYLATGKRTKAAYNFRYEQMKALGYRSLVNAYYKRCEEKE